MSAIHINMRVLHALAKFVAAKGKDGRYYLHGVLVEIDHEAITYVATDGHAMAVYRDKCEPGLAPTQFIIPSHIALNANCDKKQYMHELAYTVGEPGYAECELFDPASGELTAFNTIDGKFPEWRRFFPKAITEGGDPAQFDWHMVEKLQSCYEAAYGIRRGNKCYPLSIYPNGRCTALLLGSEPEFYACLMPLKTSVHTGWVQPESKPVAEAVQS